MTQQPTSMTITQALEADLKRIGMTQDQLGTKLGVSQQAISGWMKDGKIPSKRMAPLVELLGTDSLLAGIEKTLQGFFYAQDRDRAVYVAAEIRPRSPHRTNEATQQTPSAEPKGPGARESGLEAAFAGALPPFLRRNMEREVARVQIGSMSRSLDYLSDKIGLELIGPGTLANHWSQSRFAAALLRLVVVKQATRETHPNRQYILGALAPPDSNLVGRHMQALATDAEMLGIVLVTATEISSIASYVALTEAGSHRPDHEDDEFFDPNFDGPDVDGPPAFGDLIGRVDAPRKKNEGDES